MFFEALAVQFIDLLLVTDVANEVECIALLVLSLKCSS